MTIELALADGRVAAVGHKVRGCLLCQAAAAAIAARAPGETPAALRALGARLERAVRREPAARGPLAGARRVRAGAPPQEPARLRAAAVRGAGPGARSGGNAGA